MAGAGVPVPMDDGTAIAAAPEIVCPLPGVARSGQKARGFFAGWVAPPDLSELEGGRENAVPAYCPTLRRGAGRVGRTTHERRQKKEIGKRKDSRCKRSVGCLAPRRSTRRRKSSIRKCWEMAVPLRSSLVLLAVASSHAALQRASNKRVRALIAPVISAVRATDPARCEPERVDNRVLKKQCKYRHRRPLHVGGGGD